MLYEEVYSVRDLAIIKDLSSNFQMSWQDAGFDAESFLTYMYKKRVTIGTIVAL